MNWEIWSNDYFDRESSPCLEAQGEGMVAGCAVLWRKTLAEGVQDDGRPTFTWFRLCWEDGDQCGGVSLPRDPLANPELGRLCCWRDVAGVIGALAQSLAVKPDTANAEAILQVAGKAHSPAELFTGLGYPRSA